MIIKRISILLTTVWMATGLYAQNNVQEYNRHIADSAETWDKGFCDDSLLHYPASYDKKKLENDASLLVWLDRLLDTSTISIKKVRQQMSGVRSFRQDLKSFSLGLINVTEISLAGNYLRMEVSIGHIGDTIFRKGLVLTISKHVRCGKYGNYVLDYQLLKDFVIPRTSFPFRIRDHELILFGQLLKGSIVAAAQRYPDYNFNLSAFGHRPQEPLDQFLQNQYIVDSGCNYHYDIPDKNFLQLISDSRTDVIVSLLFSPNYYYSVNAMESLLYLQQQKRYNIDQVVKKRIDVIRNDTVSRLVTRSSDVVIYRDGYRSLQTTDEQAIRKYTY